MHVARTGWRAPIARAAVASGVLAATMTGCSTDSTAHDFDRVNAIASQLQPTQCGNVVYTGTFGSSSRADGSPPSLIVVVARDADTASCIGTRLESLGYTDATYGWFLDTEGQRVTIAAHELATGDSYTDAKGATRTASLPGISLLIRVA